MQLLFSHVNYPAQFKRLVPALVEAGHEVVFLYQNIEWNADPPLGLQLKRFTPSRQSASVEGALHPYLGRFEEAVLLGQAAARSAEALSDQGYRPDVIISHAGFGAGLYLKDVFPQARRVGLFEWYYNSDLGSDLHFLHALHGMPVPLDRAMRVRSWNAVTLLELAQCDAWVTPTKFQLQQFPAVYRDRFEVIHEGIDVALLRNLRRHRPPRPSCLPNDPRVKVVTHVARGFELYRGFPQVVQALAELQRQQPHVHALIAGADQVCYGGDSRAPNGLSWGAWARESAGLDPERTHWLGVLKTADYHALLAHSDLHVYFTIPFVLSWSLLEVMAAGVPLVCSDTGPVQEVLRDGEDALLCSFTDIRGICDAMSVCLAEPDLAEARAKRAQLRALAYDSDAGLRGWQALLGQWE